MRSWFLRPIINLSVINDRLDAVELLVSSPDLGARIKATLRKVGNPISKRVILLVRVAWHCTTQYSMQPSQPGTPIQGMPCHLDTVVQVADVPKLLHRLQQVQMRPDVKSFRLLASSLRQLLELKDLVAGVVAERGGGDAEEDPEEEEQHQGDEQGTGTPDPGAKKRLIWAQAGIAHKV
jgi:hypothetical protein